VCIRLYDDPNFVTIYGLPKQDPCYGANQGTSFQAYFPESIGRDDAKKPVKNVIRIQIAGIRDRAGIQLAHILDLHHVLGL
jgi:hypothetical protein